MRLKAAWVLWALAAVITGGAAGAVSGAFPAAAGWLAVALALATAGAALLTQDYSSGARHDRHRR